MNSHLQITTEERRPVPPVYFYQTKGQMPDPTALAPACSDAASAAWRFANVFAFVADLAYRLDTQRQCASVPQMKGCLDAR